MGQNRKNRKGEGDVKLSIEQQELIEDTATETRLFYIQVVILIILAVLTIVREINFPSDIFLMELIRAS